MFTTYIHLYVKYRTHIVAANVHNIHELVHLFTTYMRIYRNMFKTFGTFTHMYTCLGMKAAAALGESGALGPEAAQARGPRVQRTAKYAEHLSEKELERQIKKGTLLTGLFRVNPRFSSEATVMAFCNGVARKITITGRELMNRAIDGDRVAVRVGGANVQRSLSVPTKGGDGEEKDADEEVELTPEEVAIEGMYPCESLHVVFSRCVRVCVCVSDDVHAYVMCMCL
jgi:hypothetical protein